MPKKRRWWLCEATLESGIWDRGLGLRRGLACDQCPTEPRQYCAHWVEGHGTQQGQWGWVGPSSPPAQAWGL